MCTRTVYDKHAESWCTLQGGLEQYAVHAVQPVHAVHAVHATSDRMPANIQERLEPQAHVHGPLGSHVADSPYKGFTSIQDDTSYSPMVSYPTAAPSYPTAAPYSGKEQLLPTPDVYERSMPNAECAAPRHEGSPLRDGLHQLSGLRVRLR